MKNTTNTKDAYAFLTHKLGITRVKTNEPLAPHTYMKIGGPADVLFVATSLAELTGAVKAAVAAKVPFIILGGGSNVLVGDRGFRGLVIKNRADRIAIRRYKGKIQGKRLSLTEAKVETESGAITNYLVRYTVSEGLSGLEYFLGVPGTVGGAIYNNAHFMDRYIGSVVTEVRVIDRQGREHTYQKNQMKFSYDYSILQETGEIATLVTFRLKAGDTHKLWKKAEAFALSRSRTQPLNFPSSGCIFKNPNASGISYGEKKSSASAGWLIDEAGLKGVTIGGAMVSPKHANFIVNTGKATAADVLKLAERVRQTVLGKFGVDLSLEVFKIGEF